MEYLEQIREAASYIAVRLVRIPETAIVLGSGLGFLTEEMQEKKEIAYAEIPGFPLSTVPGHAGRLVCGKLNGKRVLCLSGRFHFYEGYSMRETAFYVRVLRLLSVKTLILTNAAGGINTSFHPGDLMLINDHIKLFDDSPLRGENLEEFGPRFPDMSACYNEKLRQTAIAAAEENGLELRQGVYAFMPGPSFETPAEIRMLRTLGADAVGMSTVPEAIAAAHCGMRVLALSCITNMAAGILKQPLSHEEVFETANAARETFGGLVRTVVSKL